MGVDDRRLWWKKKGREKSRPFRMRALRITGTHSFFPVSEFLEFADCLPVVSYGQVLERIEEDVVADKPYGPIGKQHLYATRVS